VNDGLKDFCRDRPGILQIQIFDGLEIEAALLRPAGYDGKTKLPLVVRVHGGPTGGGETALIPGPTAGSARYAVLYPNMRGSTGYGQKFTEMNRADWGAATSRT